MSPRPDDPASLHQAFDELTFGRQNILNLRAQMPTASEASARCEAWLRERQVARAKEVLVVTGRGKGSEDGISPVREAVLRLLPSLRRRNVIAGYQEHTAGSFVVQLAPLAALVEAPRRRREPPTPRPDPGGLRGLDEETRRLLRMLAVGALQTLGVHSPSTAMVEGEMLRQFAALAAAVPEGPEREALLQQAIVQALDANEV
jgi:hypothetical protein